MMKKLNWMKKLNCWEITECGRESGGVSTEVFSICPAAVEESMDRINGGKNGGRICWAVAGTFCEGRVQGVFACKIESCMVCPVFQLILEEEGDQFELLAPFHSMLKLAIEREML